MCKQLIGKEICKGERMSNWERRPLRPGQLHYGALDAYCMIPALKKLIEKAGNDEKKSFKKHTQFFDLEKAKEKQKEEQKQHEEKKSNHKNHHKYSKGKGNKNGGGKNPEESKVQQQPRG